MASQTGEIITQLCLGRVQLNKCMAEFMNSKIKFSAMPRLLRISCTKGLRNKMEARLAALLKSELEKNLNGFVEGSGSGGNQ